MAHRRMTDAEWRDWLALKAEWAPPREVNTRKGRRRLLTAAPVPALADASIHDAKRFRKAGFSMSRDAEEVCWWTDPDEPLPDGLRIAQPESVEIDLEGLLDWGEAKRINTRRGLREVRNAAPTPDFEALWARPPVRRALSRGGISHDGRRVSWWRPVTFDQAAAERSHAVRGAGAPLRAPEGLAYLPFQEAGIEWCLAHRRALLADEMGLGKTVQALGVVNNADDVRRVLVVAPSSLALNWQLEAEKWRMDGAPAHLVAAGRPLPNGPVTAIATYAMLTRLQERLAGEEWDLAVWDEAHYIKNPKAQRTQAAMAIPAKRDLFMTGTPILNRPLEVWTVLNRIDPEAWGDWVGFTRAYCAGHRGLHGWDATGASNLDELQRRLRSTCMVRRLKADVLRDLPAKRRQVIPIEADGGEPVPTAEESVGEEGLAALRQAAGEGGARMKVAFEAISQAMQALGRRKAPWVGEAVADLLDAVPKVVVFARHRVAVARLEAALRERGIDGIARLTGEDGREARQAAVERFQNDPDCRAFIGTIGAAGVGLTLTAASDVVFAELPWRPADLSQAEDRCHRIGQAGSVNVRHYVLRGSLDEHVARLLVDKQEAADRSLDEEVSWEGAEAPASVKAELPPERAARLAPEPARRMGGERLAALAEQCDGVRRADGMGFSLTTATAGNALLGKDPWTMGDLRRAAWVCAVHRGQIEALGHSVDDFMAEVSRACRAPSSALKGGPSP